MNDERYDLLMESIVAMSNCLAVLLKKCGEQEMAQDMYEHACMIDLQISQRRARDLLAKYTNSQP